MRNFKGVVTKHLNNYIVYHSLIKFAQNSFTNKFDIFTNFIFKAKCNAKGFNIVKDVLY